MIESGSLEEINPDDYKKDLPTPSARHPCRICGRPANYRTTFDPETMQAEWLCPDCYNSATQESGNGQTSAAPGFESITFVPHGEDTEEERSPDPAWSYYTDDEINQM